MNLHEEIRVGLGLPAEQVYCRRFYLQRCIHQKPEDLKRRAFEMGHSHKAADMAMSWVLAAGLLAQDQEGYINLTKSGLAARSMIQDQEGTDYA